MLQDRFITFVFGICFMLGLYAASHAQISPAPGGGGAILCTASARSLQYNNSGVQGCSVLAQTAGNGITFFSLGADPFRVIGHFSLSAALSGDDYTFSMQKVTTTGNAAGASGARFEIVCGTNAGSAKVIVYAGTSTTPVTITDNIGSGVTGC